MESNLKYLKGVENDFLSPVKTFFLTNVTMVPIKLNVKIGIIEISVKRAFQ